MRRQTNPTQRKRRPGRRALLGLLAALARSDVEIEKFGGYEPSLNDIFVEKVGEEE